jgi:hypothetical protein
MLFQRTLCCGISPLVASDIFREAYVVPLDATFSDISTKFIDSPVFLPTTDEVEILISDHCYSNETNFIDSAYSTMNPSPLWSTGPSPTPSRTTSDEHPLRLRHLKILPKPAQMEASSNKLFSGPKLGTPVPLVSSILPSLARMPQSPNQSKHSWALDSVYGRHNTDWLFGDFGVTETLKRFWRDDKV